MILIFITGCAEKECKTKEDCPDKTCFSKDCVDYNCSYSQIIPCCGNKICEVGESYPECVDCPNCDDKNECTIDSFDYHKQECIHEPIIPCCGNGICDEETLETHLSCSTDCPNCDDDNKLTADSFNYKTQKCENIDLVVRVGGNGTYSSIQEAIDSASNGSIIQISQGTYLENIIITAKKTLTLQGGWNKGFTSRSDDNSLTVIDGGGDGSVINIHAGFGETVTLSIEGFTIRNGEAYKSGGIFIESDGFIDATLKNNAILGNKAQGGGGITIQSNDGSINVTLTENTISGNIVDEAGGGIFVNSGGTAEVTLIGNVIADNIVTNPFEKPPSDGGGIAAYASGPGKTTLKLTNNLITENEAAVGGGIWAYAYGPDDAVVTIVLNNNIIAGNKAVYGAGIMFASGQTDTITKPGGSVICTSTNNIITENVANVGDGGVHLHSGSTYGAGGLISLSSQNDIIWGNKPRREPQLLAVVEGGKSGIATAKASYSDVGSIRTSGGGTYNSYRVINEDPLFINPENQVFLLQDNSPCIDAGNPSLAYNDGCIPPAKGKERNDMGAYGGPNNCYWS